MKTNPEQTNLRLFVRRMRDYLVKRHLTTDQVSLLVEVYLDKFQISEAELKDAMRRLSTLTA